MNNRHSAMDWRNPVPWTVTGRIRQRLVGCCCNVAVSPPCDWVPAVHAGTTKPRHSAMDWRNPVPWTVTGRLQQCLVGFFCNVADSHPCDWVPAVHAGTTNSRHSAMDWRNPEPWTVTGRIQQCLVGFFCDVADSHPCDWVPAVHAGTTGYIESNRRHSAMDWRNPVPWTVTGRIRQCLVGCCCDVADSLPCDWVPAVHAGTTGYIESNRRHSAMDWRNPVPWTVTGRIRQRLVGCCCDVADSLPCDWVPAVHAGTTGYIESNRRHSAMDWRNPVPWRVICQYACVLFGQRANPQIHIPVTGFRQSMPERQNPVIPPWTGGIQCHGR